jgi:hypothetical protein
VPTIAEQAILSNRLLLPRTFFVRPEPIRLRNGRQCGVPQYIVVARIDAGIAFNAFQIRDFPVEMPNFAAHVDALGACVAAVSASSTLGDTGDLRLKRRPIHERNHNGYIGAENPAKRPLSIAKVENHTHGELNEYGQAKCQEEIVPSRVDIDIEPGGLRKCLSLIAR